MHWDIITYECLYLPKRHFVADSDCAGVGQNEKITANENFILNYLGKENANEVS